MARRDPGGSQTKEVRIWNRRLSGWVEEGEQEEGGVLNNGEQWVVEILVALDRAGNPQERTRGYSRPWLAGYLRCVRHCRYPGGKVTASICRPGRAWFVIEHEGEQLWWIDA